MTIENIKKNLLFEFNGSCEVSNHIIVGGVFCKYHLFDTSKPIVMSFSNAGEIFNTSRDDVTEYKPWGYDFLIKQDLNVMSFSCVDKPFWYRDEEFYQFVEQLSKITMLFERRIGYGGSMGGYAASAFSEPLKLTELILFNPISSLSSEHSPWEPRYRNQKKLSLWDDNYLDGSKSRCEGYIFYDPIFKLDRLHAEKYCYLTKVRVYGVGHKIPKHLLELGLLSYVSKQCLNRTFDTKSFYKKYRNRKRYIGYYLGLLDNDISFRRSILILKSLIRNVSGLNKYPMLLRFGVSRVIKRLVGKC